MRRSPCRPPRPSPTPPRHLRHPRLPPLRRQRRLPRRPIRPLARRPQSVDASLRDVFARLPVPHARPTAVARSIFAGGGTPAAVADAAVGPEARRQARVVQLINAYRVRGHLDAAIDPLERRERVEHPELTLAYWGLTEADLDAVVDTAPAYGLPDRAPLRKVVDHLKKAYCDSIGAEFMNVIDTPQRRWLQSHLETLPNRGVLSPAEERRVFRKLCDAENFERMLHGKFPGTKRFSLEGAETLIPLLDLVVEHAGRLGSKEIVLGMAHRGRLNTLANLLDKPTNAIVAEFQDVKGPTQGSGDVKYHLGYSADVRTALGDTIHLSLTPNPSHLEVVNAVVEGRVRAKQDRVGGDGRERCMALLIHGDAAFSGQGSVMEVLNLSELGGYRTGGTIHIVVNNQIGFTTPPAESRSTPYATDIARMLGIPIFHVNGEVPRAVAAVVTFAVEWRHKFHRDVVIDMYCYRKHGHNEGDEPSFTQPMMYEAIRSRPTPREVYAKHLVRIGTLTPEECDGIYAESFAALAAEADESEFSTPTFPSALRERWESILGGSTHDPVDTRVDAARLKDLLVRANTVPDGFHAHAKIVRLFQQRIKAVQEDDKLDWALGEQAAFATLCDEGWSVRLSGQDSGRGTFSHRHAVITDITTGAERYPLSDLGLGGRFAVIDSSLSELGVMGFEVGYAFDTPDGLVMWEAQFGDFANGAQIVIDQYLCCAETKWNRKCGLTLLLPHGYEGQGPEHSSARIERFLALCAEDNMTVAIPTTPASLFHLLRRQVLMRERKPLVVFTPKSLLRHPLATSTLEELAAGAFRFVIPEARQEPARRVVLCSGKVYYDLLAERDRQERRDVALVRLEQLYPFPAEALRGVLAEHPDAEVIWCQEEPKNMGAWPTFLHWFLEQLPDVRVRYVGRPASASPATGSHHKHSQQQAALVAEALGQGS
ncbi:MAG: 2-oxoglutarate dehydrogenase E1 component [Myxococcota bacterium]